MAGAQQQPVDGQVSLADAIGNVEVLDEIGLCDSQPCIEAPSLAVRCAASLDTNFEDKAAFVTGNSKYIEEAARHAELNELLEKGIEHAVHLYTWRCCSRAVPMPKSNDQPDRLAIYTKVVEVLGPEVDKLLHLMRFQMHATSRFCEEIKRLAHPEKRKDFVSESYLLTLGKFLNMFAVLDELKNMKASIKNDYSTHRRALQLLNATNDSAALAESHNLSMFLATQNKLKEHLRAELLKIDGYEEVLTDVVNTCTFLYESHMYLTPHDKYLMVKVMAFGLYLIDGSTEVDLLAKLEQKKRINLSKLDKIFSQLEVVPLFGDMQIAPFQLVRRCAHYEAKLWPAASTEGDRCHVQIVDRLRRIREDHTDYVTHLSRIHNEMALCPVDPDKPRSDAESREIAEIALRGLQLLCVWTSDILETYSWKLMHPTDPRSNPGCPANSENYERATRYNYNAEEKSAMIEVISMIKGLQHLLVKMETQFVEAVRRHVYAELQDFVQIALREPLRKAVKNKRDYVRSILQSVRDTSSDPLPGFEHWADDIGAKKGSHAADIRTARRPVAPSSTQLYMVRTMLESLLCDRSTGKKTVRKEIDGNHLVMIENFLRMSYFWPALLNFGGVLQECCDMSQLWYREFYLEMTMGERIQFPIEMSMPWILTDHILTSRDPALTECLLYTLDLYNDSASYALTKFKKQYLYDEVEAEVNLCFDQFVFKLSEQIFTYYKQLAASILLDKRFKSECSSLGLSISTPSYTRYHTLLKQRHLQLLGRSIDLNRLVTQRIHTALQKSLDFAITKFESETLTSIVELNCLLEVNRMCHSLLAEHLPGLSDFAELLLEADAKVSAPYGRITLHVFWELTYDFLSNYCYNAATNRFVKTRGLMLAPLVKREKAPNVTKAYSWGSNSLHTAYSNIHTMYGNFVGAPHFRAIAKLIGYEGIAVVLEELCKLVKTLVEGPLSEYVRSLMKVMPKVCKLPRYDYGSPGVLEFYLMKLQDIVMYPDLRTDMFQHLRELGNAVLFALLLEQALSQQEYTDLLHAGPFQMTIPRPYVKEGQSWDKTVKRLEQRYAKMSVSGVVQRLGNSKQAAIAMEGDLLTKERLCCGLSLFEVFIRRINDVLMQDAQLWHGPPPANRVMPVDECSQFHTLWSAIQLVYCLPVGENEFNVEQLFGEGLQWAGCVLIALLGQQRRFEALDFAYHILQVNRVDGKNEVVPRAGEVTRVCERIRRFQMLNGQIFAVLNKHMKQQQQPAAAATGGDGGGEQLENVRCFAPPVHQALLNSRHQ